MPIIALPGETLEIREGKIYINNQLFTADYINDLPTQDYDEIKIEVPKNYYLVLGKHPDKNNHLLADLIHKKEIIWQVLFKIW